MYSMVLFDGTESGIQGVYWTILAIFFVMVSLSWLVASRGWLEEEEPVALEGSKEPSDGHEMDDAS